MISAIPPASPTFSLPIPAVEPRAMFEIAAARCDGRPIYVMVRSTTHESLSVVCGAVVSAGHLVFFGLPPDCSMTLAGRSRNRFATAWMNITGVRSVARALGID